MCELTNYIKGPKTGYKVVLVKKATGKYYSIAMGFCYQYRKDVPTPKKQRRIVMYFNQGLHIYSNFGRHGFRANMVGRTAIFKHFNHARNLFRDIISAHRVKLPIGYTLEVKKAIISKDVMEGDYHGPVYAGRRIEFID